MRANRLAGAATAALAITLAASAPVRAQAVTAEAPVATDPTADQISAWIAEDAAPRTLTPDADALSPIAPERRIHGEVGASVGNRGYGGYAAVSVPVGQASEIDMAVAGEHLDRHGPWRGGNRQSLALAIKLDGGDIARLISRERCNVPRWGVRLPTDPVVLPDGRCLKPETAETRDDARAARHARAGGPGSGGFGDPR